MIDKEEEEENSRVRGGRKGRGEERGSDYAGELAPSLKGRTYLLVLLALRQQPQTTLPPPGAPTDILPLPAPSGERDPGAPSRMRGRRSGGLGGGV